MIMRSTLKIKTRLWLTVAFVIATLGIVLAAFYILWMYQRTMTGEPGEDVRRSVTDLKGREVLAVAPVLAKERSRRRVPTAAEQVRCAECARACSARWSRPTCAADAVAWVRRSTSRVRRVVEMAAS